MHTDGQWTTIRCTEHLFASMYLSALSTYMTSASKLRAERDWKKSHSDLIHIALWIDALALFMIAIISVNMNTEP